MNRGEVSPGSLLVAEPPPVRGSRGMAAMNDGLGETALRSVGAVHPVAELQVRPLFVETQQVPGDVERLEVQGTLGGWVGTIQIEQRQQ